MSPLPEPGSPLTRETVKQILDEVFPAERKVEGAEDYECLAAELASNGIRTTRDFLNRVCVNRDPLLKQNPGLGHCGLARAAIWPNLYPSKGH
jgi:hypothetical protein